MEGNSALLKTWDVSSVVCSLSISHDGTRIVSGLEDGTLCVFDTQSGQLVLGPLNGHNDGVRAVFSSDGTRIASGSWDKSICIWDAQTGLLIAGPFRGHTKSISSLAFSPDGALVVSGSNDGTVRILGLETENAVILVPKTHVFPIHAVAFSPDGTHIASGSSGGAIFIWDVKAEAVVVGPLSMHNRSINSMVFSPSGRHVISGSNDRTIRILDAETGAAICEPFEGHTSYVAAVDISRDGSWVVSGSWDTTVRIWDVQSGLQIGPSLEGHTNVIKAVAFSPNGGRIYSGSSDRTIRAWDVQTVVSAGRPIGDPTNPTNTISISDLSDARFQSDETLSSNTGGEVFVPTEMTALEMFRCLVEHGCADVSPRMDPGQYSSVAIAGGSFGDIWSGKMKGGRKVAIKCLRFYTISEDRPKGFKRMMREIYMWSKAKHPNVHELMGVILFQGRLGMVSLWMEKGNLLEYIRKNPSVDRFPLCAQVAAGVSYLHSIQMVHGDIKALNVLVSQDGVAKLSDFDHSILSSCSLVFSATTNVGGGTLRWMAPELLIRAEDEDSPPASRSTETDVYALGMTFLEIVTARVPYSEYGQDMGILRALDRKQPPIRPKEVSDSTEQGNRMWSLMIQCWDHDPTARPSALSVLAYLQTSASSMVEGGQAIIVATHLPSTDVTSSADKRINEAETPPLGEPLYRRMIQLEGAGNSITIIDPTGTSQMR